MGYHYVQNARLKQFASRKIKKNVKIIEGNLKSKNVREVDTKNICTYSSNHWTDRREKDHEPWENNFNKQLSMLNSGNCDKEFWSRYMLAEMRNDPRSIEASEQTGIFQSEREKGYKISEDWALTGLCTPLPMLPRTSKFTKFHTSSKILNTQFLIEARKKIDNEICGKELLTSQLDYSYLTLVARPWTIIIRAKQSFIIAPGPELQYDDLLHRESFVFPLSSHCCIHVRCTRIQLPDYQSIKDGLASISSGIVCFQDIGKHEDRYIELLNKQIAKQSSDFIFGHDENLVKKNFL